MFNASNNTLSNTIMLCVISLMAKQLGWIVVWFRIPHYCPTATGTFGTFLKYTFTGTPSKFKSDGLLRDTLRSIYHVWVLALQKKISHKPLYKWSEAVKI